MTEMKVTQGMFLVFFNPHAISQVFHIRADKYLFIYLCLIHLASLSVAWTLRRTVG
jgi:hypothetical protein